MTGEYNYYEQDANCAEGTLNLEIAQISTDLTSPIAESVEGLVHPASTKFVAVADVVSTLDPQ